MHKYKTQYQTNSMN